VRGNQRRRFRPHLDRLGTRLLPAVGVTASVARGVVTIIGTDQDDAITAAVRVTSVRRGVVSAQVIVSVDGARRWRARQIRSIVVLGGGGNDTIALNGPGRLGLPTRIDAGDGDDLVFGGRGSDAIYGGDGNDRLWGRGGRNLLDGGLGRDELDGELEPAPTEPASVPETPVPPPLPTPDPAPPAGAQIVLDLVNLVNLERRNQGLAPLTVNAKLTRAAQIHADDMARLDRMEHTLNGVAQPTLQSRAEHVGYAFSWLGENIAYNFPDAGSVHFAWMNSSGHRANILGANFTEVGIAIARNSRGELYYCQVFGRPA
jgi:uncharacterized protein YkwD